MATDQDNEWREAAASALEWWHDAGVDTLVENQVRDWFAVPARTPAAVTIPETATATAAQALPDALDAYLTWRIGEGAPEKTWNVPIVAGEGDPAADLIVMVDHPTGDRLLTDPEAALLDRMLAAIGRTRADIHLTGLCMAEPLSGVLSDEMVADLAARAHHLVAIAGAQTVLLLSQSASRAFLGVDRANTRGHLHGINHSKRDFDAISSVHPRFLLRNPAHKREAWKDLQLLLRDKRI